MTILKKLGTHVRDPPALSIQFCFYLLAPLERESLGYVWSETQLSIRTHMPCLIKSASMFMAMRPGS